MCQMGDLGHHNVVDDGRPWVSKDVQLVGDRSLRCALFMGSFAVTMPCFPVSAHISVGVRVPRGESSDGP